MKDVQNWPKDITKWFYCMTVHFLTQQKQRKTPWNCLDGTSFRLPGTPQALCHLIITSSHEWSTSSQSSISGIWRNLKNGSTNGLPEKTSSFSHMAFINYLKDGQMCRSHWSILWIKKISFPSKLHVFFFFLFFF